MKWLKIKSLRSPEGPRVAWMLLHSGFVGMFIAFYLATANALFLSHFGTAKLPVAYIASGILGTLTLRYFARLRLRVPLVRLLLAYLGTLSVVVAGLYASAVLFPSLERAVAFGLFVALGPSLSVINLEFWGLAGCLFDLRQSKRWFPLISAGEALSSVAGFVLIPVLLTRLDGPMHLLLLAITALGLCMMLVLFLRRLFAHELQAGPRTDQATAPAQEAPRDRYFVLAASVIALATAALYLIDFSFLNQLSRRYEDPEQLAAFIGYFYGGIKCFDLVIKSLVAGRLLHHFGLYRCLLVLPTVLLIPVGLAIAVAMVSGPEAPIFFLLVALTKLLWPVLRKSIFDPAFKVLYQPLPAEQRLGFQTRIEGGVRQVGTLLVGLLLLVLSRDGIEPVILMLLLLPVLTGWTLLLSILHREYRTRLLATLSLQRPEAPAGDRAPSPLRVEAPAPMGEGKAVSPATLAAHIRSSDPAHRLRALKLIEQNRGRPPVDGPPWHELLLPLLRDNDRKVCRAALRVAGLLAAPRLFTAIVAGLAEPALTRAASLAIRQIGEPIGDTLLKALSRTEDQPVLRCLIIELLVVVGGPDLDRRLVEELRFPHPAVRDAALTGLISRSYAADGKGAGRVRDLVEQTSQEGAEIIQALADSAQDRDELRQALEEELDDRRQRIYRLLALLYDPKAVELARRGLAGVDGESVAYALEILEIIVEDELRPLVFPLLEDLSARKALARLDKHFPIQRLPARERLGLLVQSRLGAKVRSAALKAIAGEAVPGAEIPRELVAHLFHPDVMLREIAAQGLWRLDPALCKHKLRRLPSEDRRHLLRIVDGDSQGTIEAKLRALGRIKALARLPWTLLRQLAEAFVDRRLVAEQAWPAAGDPRGSLAVVIAGRLEALDGGPKPENAMSNESGRRFFAPAPSAHLLHLDGDRLRRLQAEHEGLEVAARSLCRVAEELGTTVLEAQPSLESSKPNQPKPRQPSNVALGGAAAALLCCILGTSPARADTLGQNPGGHLKMGRQGLTYQSEQNKLQVKMGARLFLDSNRFNGAFNAENAGIDTADQGARTAMVDLSFKSEHWKVFGLYAVDSSRWVLAFASYRGRNAEWVVGRQKEPFGLNYQTSSRYMCAVERPLIQALVPGISLGAQVRTSSEQTTLNAGIFHQQESDESSATARLTWAPMREPRKVLHLGFAASRRKHGAEPLRMKASEIKPATRVAQSAAMDADHSTAIGLEVASVRGPLSLQLEAVGQTVDGKGPMKKARYVGFYLQGSYFLTGEARAYDRQRGRFGPTTPAGRRGAWELVTRYSRLDLDSGDPGTEVTSLTLGVNWYLNRRLRIMADHVRTRVSGRGAPDLVSQWDRGGALALRVQVLL